MPTCEFLPKHHKQAIDENQYPISCISQKEMIYTLFTFFKDLNLGIKLKDTKIILCGAHGFNDDRLTYCEAFDDLRFFGNASVHAAFYHALE